MQNVRKPKKSSNPYFYLLIALTFVQTLLLQYVVESYFATHDEKIPYVSAVSIIVSMCMFALYRAWKKKERE
ncbi:hypothetical protein [Aneurinibacillus tyrosinisolvens]|uniref:hypothetical protein n=1 Tax=Aneurinibacillus tyrosinisolvens TaxID=1443435 RepID=UPI00063F9B5F|nr:hypothetical protein [Aneurinibacillus tyrosinisolvens]